VMSLQQIISSENNKKLFGKTLNVLIDQEAKDHYLGRTQFDAPEVDGIVFVKSREKLNPGDFVKTKITGSLEYDLLGETD